MYVANLCGCDRDYCLVSVNLMTFRLPKKKKEIRIFGIWFTTIKSLIVILHILNDAMINI